MKIALFALLALLTTPPAFANDGFVSTTGSMPFSGTTADGAQINIANFGIGESAFYGGVGIGPDANACSGANESMLRYDSTKHSMEFCNGTAWTSLSGIVASSYGNPGYVQFADGWIHEWGYTVVDPDAAPTGGFAEWLPAFPLPFPHGVFSVQGSTAGGLMCFVTGVSPYNNSNLLIAVGHECSSSGPMEITWTADGY